MTKECDICGAPIVPSHCEKCGCIDDAGCPVCGASYPASTVFCGCEEEE